MLKESCVKVTNINKINRVSRHLDDLLISIHHRIGNIMYMHTYRRSSHNNNTTSCFIQLENWHKHTLLAELLNQLDFHGTQLRAEETSFNFQFDDNEYSPKGIGCSLCTHAIKDKNSHHETGYSISPPPYTLDTPPHSTFKRKSSKTSLHNFDQINKRIKPNNNQINFIPVDSDTSNDSNYSSIPNIKPEPSCTTANNLPNSLSNMQFKATNNQEPTPTSNTQITTKLSSDFTVSSSKLSPHNTTTTDSLLSPIINSNNYITTNNTSNLNSQTVNTSLTIRCSICHTILSDDSQYFKPILSLPQIFNKQCTHQFCTGCFSKLTIIKNDNQYAWDGYPMIEHIYRKRHNTTHIFTCQLCSLFKTDKE
jgi:hypothetical protein